VPDFGPDRAKDAVALGCLEYGLLKGVRFVDTHVSGAYGLVYRAGDRWGFQEFFGYATEFRPKDGDRISADGIPLFRRRHTIRPSGEAVRVAMTFSRDPDGDVRRGDRMNEKMVWITSLEPEWFPAVVEMGINEDGTLEVVVDRGGRRTIIPRLAYSVPAALPQEAWPYQRLIDHAIGEEPDTGEATRA
jgi:hypothetical protein